MRLRLIKVLYGAIKDAIYVNFMDFISNIHVNIYYKLATFARFMANHNVKNERKFDKWFKFCCKCMCKMNMDTDKTIARNKEYNKRMRDLHFNLVNELREMGYNV